MVLPVPRHATSVIAPIRILDDAGNAVTGLTFATVGLVAQFRRSTAATWTAITLVAGTAGTYTSGGLVEDGSGWYDLGIPDAAIEPGGLTRLRIQTPGNDYRYGLLSASPTVPAISPASPTFSGITTLGGRVTIDVKQRDDYSADDGRAFAWPVTRPGVNFADPTVTIGMAGGRSVGLSADMVEATMTLLDKADGSCTVQIEFTSEQLDVPAQTYAFDAHVLVEGRRVTTTEITLNVVPKYADEAS